MYWIASILACIIVSAILYTLFDINNRRKKAKKQRMHQKIQQRFEKSNRSEKGGAY